MCRQPVVVTSPLDVFDLNKRTILSIASPDFGRVAYVVIGALQVGSIQLDVAPGNRLAKVPACISFIRCACLLPGQILQLWQGCCAGNYIT